jgi:hypothetical protein
MTITNKELNIYKAAGIGPREVLDILHAGRAAGVSEDDVKAEVMARALARPAPTNEAVDFAHGVYQGFTGGFADEIYGGLTGLVHGIGDAYSGRGDGTFSGGFKRGYVKGRDRMRDEHRQAMENSPWLTTAGTIAGGMANPVFGKGVNMIRGSGSVFKPATYSELLKHYGSVALKNVGLNAGYGVVTGAGYSEADNMLDLGKDSVKSALFDATIALGTPAVSKAFDTTVGKVIDKARILNEKRQIAKAYDIVDANPLDGHMDDVMVRMNPYGESFVIQRGAAGVDEKGKLIFKGKTLLRQTRKNGSGGTDRKSVV